MKWQKLNVEGAASHKNANNNDTNNNNESEDGIGVILSFFDDVISLL